MPAPIAVVVFIDADGDEFPVVVPRAAESWIDAAEAMAQRLVAEGLWRPAGELMHIRTEEG